MPRLQETQQASDISYLVHILLHAYLSIHATAMQRTERMGRCKLHTLGASLSLTTSELSDVQREYFMVGESVRKARDAHCSNCTCRQDLMISMPRAGAMHAAGRASKPLQAPFSIK